LGTTIEIVPHDNIDLFLRRETLVDLLHFTLMAQRKPSSTCPKLDPHAPEPRKSVLSVHGSPLVRGFVSVALIGYLFVVLLGPLSNPVGSEFLTRPMARAVAPIHRSLFLGHGYRFFGPDPGPSHMIVYRVVDGNGAVLEKRFPDRDEIWPRLLYHRWFMLSETLFQEHNFTLDQQSFAENDRELARQIEALRLKGKLRIARKIETERQQLSAEYQNTRKRINQLVAAVARNLLLRHDGTHIELFVQERSIPSPASVLTGQEIDQPQFLSPLRKIGEFRWNDSQQLESVAWPVDNLPQSPAPPSPAKPGQNQNSVEAQSQAEISPKSEEGLPR
jgi:hypothetical protein